MRKTIFCILFLLLPSVAFGQVEGPKHRIVELQKDLLAVSPLNVTQTFSLPVNAAAGYSILVLFITHINDNASQIDVICKGERKVLRGEAGLSPLFQLQSLTVASGVATSNDASSKKLVTGDKNYPARFGILGFHNITCDISSVGGTVSDTAKVQGSLVTG